MRSVTLSDSPQKENKKAEQRRTETQPTENKNREKSVLRSHRALFHFGCRPLSLRFGEPKQHFPQPNLFVPIASANFPEGQTKQNMDELEIDSKKRY